MVTIRCHFDGKALVPDEPVSLPQGEPLVAHIEENARPASNGEQSALEWMAENAIDDPSLPDDLSANLDHYLYGTPKRKP